MTLKQFFESPVVLGILGTVAAISGWHFQLTMKMIEQLSAIREHMASLAESVSGDRNDRDIVRWSEMTQRGGRVRRRD